MIDEAEKQRMMAYLHNPHPITLEFESTANQPDLFRLMGIDEDFGNEYCGEYDDEEDEIAVWPDRIVKSGRATIVFWEDGTKTVVKRSPDEPDNDYNAFLAALGIKIFGSNSQLKKIIKEKTVVQKPKKWKAVYDKEPIKKDSCPIGKPCSQHEVSDNRAEELCDMLGVESGFARSRLNHLPKDIIFILKDALNRNKSGKSTVEHDIDALNNKAKKQYEEYIAADKWTCPKCGRQYHWNVNEAGRYAFCPKCQLASKDDKKA